MMILIIIAKRAEEKYNIFCSNQPMMKQIVGFERFIEYFLDKCRKLTLDNNQKAKSLDSLSPFKASYIIFSCNHRAIWRQDSKSKDQETLYFIHSKIYVSCFNSVDRSIMDCWYMRITQSYNFLQMIFSRSHKNLLQLQQVS